MVGPGVIEAGCGDEADVIVGPLLHSPQQLLTGSEQELASKPSPSKGRSRAVKSLLGAWRLRDGGAAAVRPMGIVLLHWALSLNQRPPAMIEECRHYRWRSWGRRHLGFGGLSYQDKSGCLWYPFLYWKASPSSQRRGRGTVEHRRHNRWSSRTCL